MSSKRSVLVTGCSDNSLGAALALSFHKKGFLVFATARNLTKMGAVKSAGIKTLTLDVTSAESIKQCVENIGSSTGGTLDILVNNAGRDYVMPMLDIKLEEMAQLFEANFVSIVAMSQAFFPLLRKSNKRPVIVNNTSVNSIVPVPFSSAYSASKAAASMMTSTMRLELSCFGINVVELKTGAVASNLNVFDENDPARQLPLGSPYEPGRKRIEDAIRGVGIVEDNVPADVWADAVTKAVTQVNPPNHIWKGVQPRTSLAPQALEVLDSQPGYRRGHINWMRGPYLSAQLS
ncbi:hypothetical protein FOXB_17664 [Fusarium oxysporum f. sp. conglutinans Fo5176]|uniref:NADPH-dependent 1-acyldihydroxyacetone phosphate reductase n=1 Tax=Fusarium oxysporum (strain Fo5176) TaxID=660025 RepID=F9GG80_FUSOF|nr:hypothetical protein FOXB_17664 [Fusarium oxysporum f. sp. conglutinans Fo5176]